MPVSVHLASTNGMQVFENTREFFCLRSKRSVVRIHSGVPFFSWTYKTTNRPTCVQLCSRISLYRVLRFGFGRLGMLGKHPVQSVYRHAYTVRDLAHLGF